MDFDERKTCWVSKAPQGSDTWYKLRKARITSSNLATCTGRSSYRVARDELANRICKDEEYETNMFMKHGITMEPIIRDWYSDTIRKKINETGIAIWKKDPRFGGSLDGEIEDEEGIEIKAPYKMYHRLIEYIESRKKGYNFYPGYHEHIYNSHYDQMVGNAIITDKKHMHYIVVCTDTQQAFVQRFPVDVRHWENVLYPRACEFYDTYIQPKIDSEEVLRIDP